MFVYSGSQPQMFLLLGVLLAHGYSNANDKAPALLWQLLAGMRPAA